MAKGSYYFPLYYQRLLTSTTGWTDEQFGAYLRLLIYQYDKGSVPNDPKIIKKIAPKAIKNWKVFESKFEKNSTGDLINPVMDDIRKKNVFKSVTNSENGSKGGRRKSERLDEDKANASENESERLSETKATPLTINQQPIESTIEVSGDAHDLKDSNLFRKPKIPTKHQVWEVFKSNGGTKEMAKAFWEKHEATGWFIHGSPIVNYVALASKFITTWHSVGNQKKDDKLSSPALKKF